MYRMLFVMHGSMVIYSILANVEKSEMSLYKGCCFRSFLEWVTGNLQHVLYDVGVKSKYVYFLKIDEPQEVIYILDV